MRGRERRGEGEREGECVRGNGKVKVRARGLTVTFTRLHTCTHTQARAGDAGKVLKSIRFPNMSRDFLLHIVETEEIVKGNSDCLQMVSDVIISSLLSQTTWQGVLW